MGLYFGLSTDNIRYSILHFENVFNADSEDSWKKNWNWFPTIFDISIMIFVLYLDDFFVISSVYATSCNSDFRFSVSFNCSAATKTATSIPDEQWTCYFSTTINPRGSKFGSSTEDISNLEVPLPSLNPRGSKFDSSTEDISNLEVPLPSLSADWGSFQRPAGRC